MSRRLLVVLCVAVLALCPVLFALRVSVPSDGTVVPLSDRPFDIDRMTIGAVLDARSALRTGDQVVAIDGVPLRALAGRTAIPRGQPLRYTVLRDGHQVDAFVPLGVFPFRELLRHQWAIVLMLALLLGIAGLVFSRRPNDPAARVLFVIACTGPAAVFAYLLGDQTYSLATRGPSVADVVGEAVLAMVWSPLMHFALVAPGSTLARSRRRVVVLYAAPWLLHLSYLAIALPGTDSAWEARGRMMQVSLVPSSVLPLAAAVLMIRCLRSIENEESRRRMRWVAIALSLGSLAWLILWAVPSAVGLPALAPTTVVLYFFLPSVLVLAAAVLRYRLFDIQILLRRSLLEGAVAVTAVAVFLIANRLIGRLLLLPQALSAVPATVVVALLAPSLRSGLHRSLGRLLRRGTEDPFEVVASLTRINTATDPQAALDGIARTVARALRLPHVAIELGRAGGGHTIRAASGSPVGQASVLPLTGYGDVTGTLTIATGGTEDGLGPADHRLLAELVRQVGSAAAAIVLTDELRRSRERLVLAREEERRRLHQRLHDGLGPSLAASLLRLSVARDLLRRDQAAAERAIDEQVTVIRALVGELRALVDDLRPPALDVLGLAGAIDERLHHLAHLLPDADPPRIVVQSRGVLEDLPAAVEVAAFWISVEAASNAIRHAHASTCRITLVHDEALSVQVADDGTGLPDQMQPGGGLVSMAGRARELGGTFWIGLGSPHGTVVRVTLPVQPADPAAPC